MSTAQAETGQRVRAQARYLRITPRKARLVTEHIQGRTVPEARTVLAFTERAAAREIEKILRSAVANAEANHNLIGDDMYVSAAFVDEGPVLKRWRARARGRVARIRKRTCHVTLELLPVPGAATATSTRRRRRGAAEAPAEKVTPKRGRRQPAPAETAEPEIVEPEALEPEASEPESAAEEALEPEPDAAAEAKPSSRRRRKKTEGGEA